MQPPCQTNSFSRLTSPRSLSSASMASTTSGLFFLFFSMLIGGFAISAAARPCKTIFFITSSSNDQKPSINSPRLTFYVTGIREFHRTGSYPRPIFIDRSSEFSSNDVVTSQPYYSASASSVKTSIRDRTMDIMSIVGALLFGIGCGALTAATVYLIWSLFSTRRFEFSADSDEEEYDDEETTVNTNKMAYIAIPAATKPVPPSAEEVDAMK